MHIPTAANIRELAMPVTDKASLSWHNPVSDFVYESGNASWTSGMHVMTAATASNVIKKGLLPSHLWREKKESSFQERKEEARYCSFRRDIR